MRSRSSWVIVLASVALAGTGCSDGPVAADAITFNYCGNVCAKGGDHGATFVVDLVAESGAEVVMLQEICRSQAERLREDLESVWDEAALAYTTTFAEDLGGANACVGDDYGMAILAPSIAAQSTLPLPNPGLGATQIDERKVLCADVGAFLGCTTHLVRSSNDAEAHDQQISALIQHLRELASEHEEVVVAGDVNDRPGRFEEVVEAGTFVAASHDRIDQVFATAEHYRRIELGGRSCECSDHDALLIELHERS